MYASGDAHCIIIQNTVKYSSISSSCLLLAGQGPMHTQLISTQVMDDHGCNLYGCSADNLVFRVKVASSGSTTGMLLCTT